jgi:hypothetical protein
MTSALGSGCLIIGVPLHSPKMALRPIGDKNTIPLVITGLDPVITSIVPSLQGFARSDRWPGQARP